MTLSMAPILMYSDDVPQPIRAALRAAYASEASEREDRLRNVAHLMVETLDLDCADVRELVGL
jgi:hypothetical protein